MAVHVKHLNADSTFLLTFATASTPSLPADTSAPKSNATFTVLTDPWLADTGAPQYHPKFAFAARKIPAHISHLSQIDPPDVVVISQANTDHCHEETLRQLPADLPHTTILAHPDAAKKIRSWKYFKPHKVHAMPTYSDKNHNTVIRFSIPSKVPGSTPGEATVTLIRQPRDMTKLHNAVAITYRAPVDASLSLSRTSPATSIPSLHSMRSQPNISEPQQPMTYQLRSMLSTPALKQRQITFQPNFPAPPLTPPETPPESEQDPHERPRSSARPRTATPPRCNFHLRNPSDTPSYRQRSRGSSDATSKTLSTITRASSISDAPIKPEFLAPTLSMARLHTADSHMLPPSMPAPTSPLPPLPSAAPFSPVSSIQSPVSPMTTPSTVASVAPAGHSASSSFGSTKTLSVLYAPHGINYASVKPYATTHLVQTAALPLTLVMHPFDRIDNPWWLGGNISAGVPGGVEIVRRLMGRHWVKTHDEEKEETGFGLKMLRKGRWNVEEVEGMLETGLRKAKNGGKTAGGKGGGCSIRELECGEEMLVGG